MACFCTRITRPDADFLNFLIRSIRVIRVPPLLRLHRKMQRIPLESCREVGLVDASLRFGFRQDLHHRHSVTMRVEHDVHRLRIAEEKDADEDVCHEIHRRHVIVVDEDAVQRFEDGLLIGGDLDGGQGGHALNYTMRARSELVYNHDSV